jgi:hypothetical protein
MHKLAFTISALVVLLAQPSQATDLKGIFRDALAKYAEQKAQEHGIDLNGNTANNVSLTFAGAEPTQSDVFESLHSASPEPAPSTVTTPESDCFNKVQGKIAWNSTGSRQWSAGNIKKLCAGTRVASAPPQCFSDAMFKTNLWGKKPSHKMNWALASQLCAGTNNARTPITCLKNQLNRKLTLRNAINACDSDPNTRVVIANNRPPIMRPPITRPPVTRLPTKKLEEKACYEYVQGRIAWDAAGKKRSWAESNVKRLCKGTTSKYAAGNCFSYAMHKGSSWGKKPSHKMTWSIALDLCEGTNNAQQVTGCFKSAIAAGKTVNSAVRRCS